jgi:hypothetical protein
MVQGDTRTRHRSHTLVCIPSTKSLISEIVQVALATEMMRRAEHRFGEYFDVVLRMRPDMCLQGAMRTLSTGLANMWRCSPLSLAWIDAMAIYPRWAADAVATKRFSHSDHGCEKRADTNATKTPAPTEPSPGYLPTGSLALLGVSNLEVVDFFCPMPPSSPPSVMGVEAPVEPWPTGTPGCNERVAIRRDQPQESTYRQAGERNTSHCQVWS